MSLKTRFKHQRKDPQALKVSSFSRNLDMATGLGKRDGLAITDDLAMMEGFAMMAVTCYSRQAGSRPYAGFSTQGKPSLRQQ